MKLGSVVFVVRIKLFLDLGKLFVGDSHLRGIVEQVKLQDLSGDDLVPEARFQIGFQSPFVANSAIHRDSLATRLVFCLKDR